MNVELIWAQDENGGIGKEGKLPWHISEDLQNFKKITLNSVIIMGRKTWDSLPFKPLPKRRNIILSSKKNNNVETYTNIENCLNALKADKIDTLFVIGGRSLYNNFYSKASYLHITIIHLKEDGIDTFLSISMKQIKKDFTKIKTQKLSDDAIYTKWARK
ncbi:MAG: dihydrofolate reductase [Candidatus Marinimicrobia bacterium]|nr:dihydrofolate reductase [Candidatus Neomarinimicrobiota bacterium]|tara:strand:+ start:8845 stop:9324 length:480 start_codon:yes stop_codon:yes gene_type:complete